MSGHSKLANIKHRKEKNDVIKGKISAVIGREVAIAVKKGGSDPADDSKLQDVIVRTKANNVPNDMINNGVKKAAGGLDNVNYEQNVYEGYGPSGVTAIVETLADNKNRMTTNAHAAFLKGGGNVGTPGCVPFMFSHKGQIIIDKEEYEMDPDEPTMFVLDAGTGDFADDEDSCEMSTGLEQFLAVREAFEQKDIPMLEADVKTIPQNWASLRSEEDQKKMQRILDLLDEDDDVQAVFYSWDEE